MLAPWKKSYDKPRQRIKNKDITLLTQVCRVKPMFFSSSHVWMWELNHKEGWAPRNLCFWTVVLEKTLESFLDRKEIKPVNPEGNELWIVIGRTDADAEAAILWPPDRKIWLIGKDPNAGKDWGKEKGTTKDEMVGWHHWLNGHEFTQKLHEIMKDGEAWCAAVHGVTKSWTRLSDWSTTEYLRLGCRW